MLTQPSKSANLICEQLSTLVADDPSGETGCSTHGIDSQLVILSKVETYSFPIANETQPHRYIHLTATGSLGQILLEFEYYHCV